MLFRFAFSIADGEPPVRLESSQSLTPAGDGTLVFREVSLRDRGTYLCEANNGVGGAITNRVRLLLNGKEVQHMSREKAFRTATRRTGPGRSVSAFRYKINRFLFHLFSFYVLYVSISQNV